MAAKYDLHIDQGSTFTRDFIYEDEDGAPQNLAGYSARMMIRKAKTSLGEPTFDSNDAAGALVVTGAEGKVTLTLTDDVTQALPAPFEGFYDIELDDGSGVITRLIQGRVFIDPNVTRD